MVYIAASCTQELDMPFPQGKEQLVLNSILHPDSTIKISLTKTLPLGSTGTDFPVVDNAEIRLYEDEVLVGMPAYQDSIYILDYLPKAGKEYRIEVDVPGYTMLQANDRIPKPPVVSACVKPDKQYKYYGASIDISLEDDKSVNNVYWFNIDYDFINYFSCERNDGGPIKTEACRKAENGTEVYYKSYSSLPDRFNAFIDNTSNGASQYDFFIRISDQTLEEEQINFNIASNMTGLSTSLDFEIYNYLNIISASRHYDRFLKSSVIYAQNRADYDDDDGGFRPFSETTQTYSNVENGTGIFAAYNSVTIPLIDYPCEQ